jgi:hypothetical protein
MRGEAFHGRESYHRAVPGASGGRLAAVFWHHARMKLPALAFAFALLAPAALAASVNDGGRAREFSHALKPGDVAEECLRLEAGRSRSFEWSADAPVDFNIHYHRGNDVAYPVKANQRREGKGRFTASAGEDYCWMWTARGPTKVTGKLGPEE